MSRRIAVIALLAGLAACGQGDPIFFGAPLCEVEERSIGRGEVGSVGVSGEEVVAWARAAYSRVDVVWAGDAEPASETFAFTMGEPVATSERSQSGGPECAPRSWVNVEIPVEVSSVSGHVSAEGVIDLAGLHDEGGLHVYAMWPHEEERMPTTITGPYLEAAEREHGGLQRAYLSLGARGWRLSTEPLRQFVAIGGDWTDARGSVAGSIYDCVVVDGVCAKLAEVPSAR